MARLIIDLWDDRVQYFRAILEELRQRYGVRVELNIIENYLILRERWTRRSEAERKKAEETNEAIGTLEFMMHLSIPSLLQLFRFRGIIRLQIE